MFLSALNLKKIVSLMTALLCLTASIASANETKTSEPQIPIINTPPVIDGQVNDKEWQQAVCASGFTTTNEEWPVYQTSAYVYMDKEYLYIAFKCPGVTSKIKSEKYENDSTKLFREDSVEIFIAPNLDDAIYYHLGINAAGSVYSAKSGDGRDTSWEPQGEFVTKQSTNNWMVEGRVSLKSLGIDGSMGTAFKINFCRNNLAHGRVSSSWTGQSNFHDKRQMKTVKIAPNAGLNYSLQALDSHTGINLVLRNNGKQQENCRVEVSSGDSTQTVTQTLNPENADTIQIQLPASFISQTVSLKVFGKNFNATTSAVMPASGLFTITPEVYRCKFPAGEIKVVIENHIADGESIQVKLQSSASGKVLQHVVLDASQTMFAMDFDGYPVGRYVMSAKLIGKAKNVIASDDRVVFIKDKLTLNALPQEQTITIKGTSLFMNDVPFFPLMASPSNVKLEIPVCFNVQYGPAGLRANAPLRGTCGIPAQLKRNQGSYYEIPAEEKVIMSVRKLFEKTADQNFLYRSMQYEAQYPMRRNEAGSVTLIDADQEYLKIHNLIKAEFPQTLTSIQTDRLEKLATLAPVADIIEAAAYSSSYARYPQNKIVEDIAFARTQIGNKPLVWWIGASVPSPDARTAENIRVASYLALISGANGIVYHNGHGGVPQSRTRFWSIFQDIANEFETLYPIIVNGKLLPNAAVTSESGNLKILTRQYGDSLYIIAINPKPVSVVERIVINMAIGQTNAAVMFESRNIKVTQNNMQDLFTPLEPHVYRIKF